MIQLWIKKSRNIKCEREVESNKNSSNLKLELDPEIKLQLQYTEMNLHQTFTFYQHFHSESSLSLFHSIKLLFTRVLIKIEAQHYDLIILINCRWRVVSANSGESLHKIVSQSLYIFSFYPGHIEPRSVELLSNCSILESKSKLLIIPCPIL